MTITLTPDTVNSRVQINATGLAGAVYATVERSVDQILWKPVRGGAFVALSGGALAAPLYDYEFVSDVPNFYRVRGLVNGITFVAGGGGAGGNNAAIPVNVPVGTQVGDLMIAFCAIRNAAATVTTPAGWVALATLNNVKLIGRRMQAGDTGVTVSFAGGVAGDTTTVKIASFRGADAINANSNAQINTTQQNIQFPICPNGAPNRLAVAYGWKQTAALWTSVATLSGYTELDDVPSSDGSTQGLVWDYQILASSAALPSDTFIVTGGAPANSYGLNILFDPLPGLILNEQISASITPTLNGQLWLKSTARSFLNRPIVVTDYDEPSRDGRGGSNYVDTRTLPIGQVELMGGRKLSLRVRVESLADARKFDYVVASGDIMFVHAPAGCPVASGYYRIDGMSAERPRWRAAQREFTLPLVECAAPGPDIVTAQSTWDSVIAQYGTWENVIAKVATWEDLLLIVGDPSEVIVP